MGRTLLLLSTMVLAIWLAVAPALAAPTDESAICQNPQQVLTVGPSADDISTAFTTTGDAFRVRFDVDFNNDAALNDAVEIDIVDRSDR